MMKNYDNSMGKNYFQCTFFPFILEFDLDKMILGRIQLLRKLNLFLSLNIGYLLDHSAIPSTTNPSRPQSSYLDRDGALSSRPVTESPKHLPQTVASFEPKRNSACRRTFVFSKLPSYF